MLGSVAAGAGDSAAAAAPGPTLVDAAAAAAAAGEAPAAVAVASKPPNLGLHTACNSSGHPQMPQSAARYKASRCGWHAADGSERDASGMAAVMRDQDVRATIAYSSKGTHTQWQWQQLTCRRDIVQQWRRLAVNRGS